MSKLIIFNFLVFLAVVNGNLPNKIYGGDLADNLKYPFQVSVQLTNHHICGGSIISNSHILTAASCVLSKRNVYYGNIKILSGTYDLDKVSLYWKIHEVAFIIPHEDYEPQNNWFNDIAILKLSSPMIFDLLHEKIVVFSDSPKQNIMTITGWGISPITSIMSRLLQSLRVRSLYIGTCKKLYNHPVYHSLERTQYCLVPVSPTARITMGNSGSPVIIGKKIAGIVSSLQVTSEIQPAIYTRANWYYNWIQRNMESI